MKKLLVLLMLLCSMLAAQAQDVIVKKDGSTIVCRVKEVTKTSVKYQPWSDPYAPEKIISMAKIAQINYEKGRRDEVQQVDKNQYAPYSQNSGEGQYNDNALLDMQNQMKERERAIAERDRELARIAKLPKKAKMWKYIGWVGGATLVAGGIVCFIGQRRAHIKDDGRSYEESGFLGGARAEGERINITDESGHTIDSYYKYTKTYIDDKLGYYMGTGLVAGGIAVGVLGYFMSNKYQRAYQKYSLVENDFMFKNGTSLNVSVDVIKDGWFNTNNTNNIGIGLRYNF